MKRKDLIKELDEIRLEKGFTQDYLSEITGMKQSYISRFFKADVNPRLDSFILLSKALDQEIKITGRQIDWDYLLKQVK